MVVSQQGGADDAIINFGTLKRMGAVDKDFPKINSEQFKRDSTRLEEFKKNNDYDQYGF